MSALSELREALEYAGLKTESAERIAYALQTREFINNNLATKEDILQTEIKLKEEIQEVKKETLLLRQEITKQENKILWFFASGIGLVIISQILLSFLK